MAGHEAAIRDMLTILGFAPRQIDDQDINQLAAELGLTEGGFDETMDAILSARAAARSQRDFARSDLIRDRLESAGIVVEDTPDGARWFRR